MAGFHEQLEAARKAHYAATALEISARQQIAIAFAGWENGQFTPQSIRWELESIVRSTYRASAVLAAELAARQSGLPEWKPVEIFNTEYLQNLLSDVRRNLREYKSSSKDEAARRRAVMRMEHSAGVAAQRGYTDSLILAYEQLQDFGFQLRKIWLANFVNNTPCEHCRKLHGTEVELHEEFPAGTSRLKVYGDLKGPPRHPRCRCYLAILIVALDNALDALNIDKPTPAPQSMTTDDVKSMPRKVFRAIVSTLRKVLARIRGGSDGQ